MNALMPFTLRFWQALQHPPVHHSLFRRIAEQYMFKEEWTPFWLGWSQNRKILSSGVLTFIFVVGIFTVPQLLTFLIFILPIMATILYVVLHGTMIGLQQCLRISSIIARARERGMYDLLALAPIGAFGITWTLCTGSIYYDTTAGGSTAAHRVWISRILFLAVFLLIGLMSLATPRNTVGSPSGTLVLTLITVLLIGFSFFLDDMLSSVIGIQIGLIVPMLTTGIVNTRAVAAALFLLLQLISYLLAWVIGFIVLPEAALTLSISPFAGMLFLRLAQVAMLFLVRELIARVLWYVFRRLMDNDVTETATLLQGLPRAA